MNENVKNPKQEKGGNYYSNKQNDYVYNQTNLFFDVLKDFELWLNENDYTKKGAYKKKRNLIYFLSYLENKKINNLEDVNRDTIINYVNDYPKYYTICTKVDRNKELRVILRFLYNKFYVKEDLSIFVPKIRYSNKATIPSYWSVEEIQKILQNINTKTKTGKRFYLVLLLAIKYGLRNSDIINLKLNDINWKKKTISLIQAKTNVPLILPLLPEVEDALVDYIKFARPQSMSRKIILKLDGTEIENYNFHNTIKGCLKKANIENNNHNKKKGIHSFRHSLASIMLQENIPLPIISKILGHSSTENTTNYLKIDKNSLKKCYLNVNEVIDYE